MDIAYDNGDRDRKYLVRRRDYGLRHEEDALRPIDQSIHKPEIGNRNVYPNPPAC